MQKRLRFDKRVVIRIFIYFIGMGIACLGTALMNLNELGSDAMNTLFTAIATKLNVLPGRVYTVFNSVMLLLGFVYGRRYMGIGSILMILVQGFFMDTWMGVFASVPWLFEGVAWRIITATVSHMCRALGTALATSMCLGTAGFEAWLFTMADRVRVEYKYLKMGSEVLFFIAALFLDGVYGVMTVAAVLLYGPTVSFFMIRLNKTLWKQWGIADERNALDRNRRPRPASRI